MYKGLVLTVRPSPIRLLIKQIRTFTFYPVRIADFTHIGPNCIIEAAQIGSCVEIGEGSIVVRPLFLSILWIGSECRDHF